jgi:hypothetical protein
MQPYARRYVAIALFWLLAGMLQGFWMGATNAIEFKSTHVAMMMLGFVLPLVFGVLYRLWPELGTGVLAQLQFWLTVVGGPVNMLGALQITLTGGIMLAVIGSSMLIVSGALLLYLFGTRVLLAASEAGDASGAVPGRA